MWKEGLSYDEAFEKVKKARAISRPNIGFVKTLEAWHEERTNRSSSSSSGSDVISYRIVEHENRKGYVVPKRETPSSFAAANNTPFSPKDDPNAVILRFKSEMRRRRLTDAPRRRPGRPRHRPARGQTRAR